ncbi:phage holin family protein [Streptococcus sp. 19428wD3_AN2]|nr:phage holin family protein [Streptococcus sp. 19428wD3_AN2]TFU83826.1 holin [Streptococcus sp. AN2]
MQDLLFRDLLIHLRGLMTSPYIHFFFWLMLLDIVTGYIKAFKMKRFDSKTGTLGLLRHALVFVVILIVAMYARALGVRTIGIAWCMFFIFNYLGSVIENWEAIGIGFPDFLRPYINQMKKENTKIVQTLIDSRTKLPDSAIQSDDKYEQRR